VFFDYPDSEDDPDSVGQAPPRPAADVFLASASDREWEVLLSHCQRRHFAPAEAVVGPGTTSRSLHLVVNGTLEVLTTAKGVGAKGIGTKGIGAKGVGAKGVGAKRRGEDRYQRMTTIGPGSIFGELSFFDGDAPSDFVRAVTTAEVAELSPTNFDALAALEPRLGRQVLFDLGRLLAERLRWSRTSG
jgi:CRP/FNR family cyclic AMP-dependent transcriptional regulator